MTDDPRLRIATPRLLAALDAVDPLRQAVGTDAVDAAYQALLDHPGCFKAAFSAAIAAALPALHARIAELKQSVTAFCGPHAVNYAREHGLPDRHLHPTHYDLLRDCGARMDDFVRADIGEVATPATDGNAPRDPAAANAKIERLRGALATCVGALEPLLERWDRFARSDGNQADAYYNLAKGTHDKWHAARAALTAAKQAMEGGTS